MHEAVKQIWVIDSCGGLPKEVSKDIDYLQEEIWESPSDTIHPFSQDDCEQYNLHNLQVFMQEHGLDFCYIHINW